MTTPDTAAIVPAAASAGRGAVSSTVAPARASRLSRDEFVAAVTPRLAAGATWPQIAAELRCEPDAARMRAYRYGVKWTRRRGGRKRHRWTDAELARAAGIVADIGIGHAAAQYGIGENALRTAFRRNGWRLLWVKS